MGSLPLAVFPFEDIGADLTLLPLAARRALDRAGLKLSRESWRSLPIDDRRAIAVAGVADVVDVAAVRAIAARAQPPAEPIEAADEPDPLAPPEGVAVTLDPSRARAVSRWATLRPIDRFALAHEARAAASHNDPARLERAIAAIVGSDDIVSTHVTPRGDVHMVDVAAKPQAARRAVAAASIRMKPETLERLARRDVAKGEVLATARIAGILAAKRTPELIPLCHGLALTHVEVRFGMVPSEGRLDVEAVAEAVDRTGVEMEALVAVSIACLTVYDMLKGVDRAMVVSDVRLIEKSGGRSGHYVRDDAGKGR